jgi:hypothetical protein
LPNGEIVKPDQARQAQLSTTVSIINISLPVESLVVPAALRFVWHGSDTTASVNFNLDRFRGVEPLAFLDQFLLTSK